MSPLALGVCLPQFSDDPQPTLDVAREVEALGYDSVSLYDHLQPLGGPPSRPILECFTMLTAVASVTSRIGLRSLVARATLRPPAMLAHQARSLWLLSGGRFTLGIGAGDRMSDGEDASVGLLVRTTAARHDLVRAAVEAARAQAPELPVWLGGTGPAMQRLAGELGAQAWNVWGGTPGEVRAGLAAAEEAALAFGSPPPVATWAGPVLVADTMAEADRRRADWVGTRTDRDAQRLLWGDADRVHTQLAALAGAGVVECLCSFVGGQAAEQRALLAPR